MSRPVSFSVTQPATAESLWHIAFYHFVALPDPDAVAARLRELTRWLTGSILVAPEGINGVLAGSSAALDAFQRALTRDDALNAYFIDTVFRLSACKTAPFARMKVHCRKAIVAFGVDGVSPASDASSVSPQAWRELIAQDDVVVLDNRNSFEYRLGKFKAAIDPKVPNFRDFPKYVETNAPAWKAQGKRVAMYCTGGIRCEKASSWMRDQGLEVFQLEGGILNYFQSIPDADKDWEGECFVFDNRIALNTSLRETDTTLEQVYDGEPDGQWRVARARRLDAES